MRKAFFLTVLLAAFRLSNAQDKSIDSAKNLLGSAKNDSIRFYWLSWIFYKYLFSTPDSYLPYAQQALAFRQMKSDFSLSEACGIFGDLHYLTCDFLKALVFDQRSLRYAERSGGEIKAETKVNEGNPDKFGKGKGSEFNIYLL